MYIRVPIKNLKIENNKTFVVTAYALRGISKESKKHPYLPRIVKSLEDGLFYAVVTSFEWGKLKKITKESEIKRFIKKISKNEKAMLTQAIFTDSDIKQYKEQKAYDYLFKLVSDKNLHLADLTSIIAAIELELPLVTDDPHIWRYQNRINEAYRNRYDNVKETLELYTTQDFCKLVLKI